MFIERLNQRAIRVDNLHLVVFPVHQNELSSIGRDISQKPGFLRVDQFAFIKTAVSRRSMPADSTRDAARIKRGRVRRKNSRAFLELPFRSRERSQHATRSDVEDFHAAKS